MKSLDMAQQAWLQSLISYRTLTENHAKALHKAATEACSSKCSEEIERKKKNYARQEATDRI